MGGLRALYEGLGPLIMMGMGQQCYKLPIFQILAFYIKFKGGRKRGRVCGGGEGRVGGWVEEREGVWGREVQNFILL